MSKPTKTTKIIWKKLDKNDLVQLGDFFSSEDPNTPELQGEGRYNLQMRACHPINYGKPSDEVKSTSGRGHWRPIGLTKQETIMV